MRCDECEQKGECVVLCDDVEAYVSQDEVSQRELTIGLPYIRPLKIGSNIYLTPRQREVVTLLGKGLTRQDVCQVLNITRHTLRNYLYKIKQKE